MIKYLLLKYDVMRGPARPPIITFLFGVFVSIVPLPWLFLGWELSTRLTVGPYKGDGKPYVFEDTPELFLLFSSVFFIVGAIFLLSGCGAVLQNYRNLKNRG